MKKFILSLLMLAAALSGYAQDSLKGSWFAKHSLMGFTMNETMIFSGDNSGKVINKGTIDINASILTCKITGKAEVYLEGAFTFDGNKIVVKWDKNTLKFKNTKEMEVTVKGQKVDNNDIADLFQSMIDDIKKEAMSSCEKDEIYTDVKITSKKLSYKTINEEGKTESESYTRLK